MTAREFWQRRSATERRTLAIGALAAAALLFVAFAWLPLERARARLEREVPELRATVAALDRDAAEVKRLRAMPPAAKDAGAPLAALAAGSVPVPPWTRLTLVDPRHVRLAGEDASFGALLEWLSVAAPAQGLQVQAARIEALAAPGRVRLDLTLSRP
jgi:general secretion pathway protein M